jgi:hypothetical protein
MPSGEGTDARASRVQEALDRARLRGLAIRVLIVQVLALAALWLLQSRFGAP